MTSFNACTDEVSVVAEKLSRYIGYDGLWYVSESMRFKCPWLTNVLYNNFGRGKMPPDLISRLAVVLQSDKKSYDEACSLTSWISCGISRVKLTEEDIRNVCPELGSSFRISGWNINVLCADDLWRSYDVPHKLSLMSLRSDLLYLKNFKNPVSSNPDVTVKIDCHPSLYSAIISCLPLCHWEIVQSSLCIRLRSVLLSSLGIPCSVVVCGMGNPTTSLGRGSFPCMLRFVRGQDRCSCLTFEPMGLLTFSHFSPCCSFGCGFKVLFSSSSLPRFTRFPGATFGLSVFPCDVHVLYKQRCDLERRGISWKKINRRTKNFLKSSSLHFYSTWEEVLKGFGFSSYHEFSREWSFSPSAPYNLPRVLPYDSLFPLVDFDLVQQPPDQEALSNIFPDLAIPDTGQSFSFSPLSLGSLVQYAPIARLDPRPLCSSHQERDLFIIRGLQRFVRTQTSHPSLKRLFKRSKTLCQGFTVSWSDPSCHHTDSCGCVITLDCLFPEFNGISFTSCRTLLSDQLSDLVNQMDSFLSGAPVIALELNQNKDSESWHYFRRLQTVIRRVKNPMIYTFLRSQRRLRWSISVVDGWVYCYTSDFLFSFPEGASDIDIESNLYRTCGDVRSTGVILSSFVSSFDIIHTPDFWSLQGRGSFLGINFSGPRLVDLLLDMFKRGFYDDPCYVLESKHFYYSSCLTDGERSELISRMIQVMRPI